MAQVGLSAKKVGGLIPGCWARCWTLSSHDVCQCVDVMLNVFMGRKRRSYKCVCVCVCVNDACSRSRKAQHKYNLPFRDREEDTRAWNSNGDFIITIISNIIIIIIVVVIMGLYGVGAPFGLSLDTPLSIRYGVYVNVYLIVWATIVLPSSWFPVSPVGSPVYKIKACTQTGSWWTNNFETYLH